MPRCRIAVSYTHLQQLYEKKLLTYPRTDSQYLTDDMQPAAESIVSGPVSYTHLGSRPLLWG